MGVGGAVPTAKGGARQKSLSQLKQAASGRRPLLLHSVWEDGAAGDGKGAEERRVAE